MPSKRKSITPATKAVLKKSKSRDENDALKQKISDLKNVVEIKSHEVDQFFSSDGIVEVYENFNCMLNKTDIDANNNKFYVLQLIEEKSSGNKNINYVVWTRWGRVGEIGQHMVAGSSKTLADALKIFKKKFTDKTGIDWEKRDSCPSRKGKYTIVEVVPDDAFIPDEPTTDNFDGRHPSKLDKETYRFVRKIFDLSMFNRVLEELHLDTKKMPLGKLSSRQIAVAFEALSDVQTALKTGKGGLSELSSRFYTAMPHEFGRQRPPVINTEEMVQAKFDMLNVLSDVALAQSIQKNKDGDKSEDEVTTKYNSLKCKMTYLPSDHPEREVVSDFFTSTKGPHGTLLNVWKLDRDGEAQRFQTYTSRRNHKLLWHGTNFGTVAAILHSGLRIMPHSGGLVGKGVYFASRAAKSQQYVSQDVEGHYVLLLAEVFLGEEHPIYTVDHAITAPPQGFDSVVAQGRIESVPKKEKELDLDGVKIRVPRGPAGHQKVITDFEYSEYLVYNEAQIRLRYVLQLL